MNSPQEDQLGVFSVFKPDNNSRQTPFYCRWTEQEDQLLFEAVEQHGPHKWSLIAQHIPGRTPVQCSTRWLGALNPHVHKGRWSPEEDQALTLAVQSFEYTNGNLPWSRIAQSIPNRTGIQCQARWTEALDPSVRKGRWMKEEDELLHIGVQQFGCCWIRVASSIPGRTQRQCRTRWNQIQTKLEKTRQKQSLGDKLKKKTKKKRTTKKKQVTKPEVDTFLHQEAIVIPSEITSPVQSTSSLSTVEDDDDDYERRDYFIQKQRQKQEEEYFHNYLYTLDNYILDPTIASITLSV